MVSRQDLSLFRGELFAVRYRDRATRHAQAHFRYCGLRGSGSHILPVLIGEDGAAVQVAAALRHSGFDVRAIRPPTVPAGTARLRVSLTLNASEAAVEGLFQALGPELAARRVTASVCGIR